MSLEDEMRNEMAPTIFMNTVCYPRHRLIDEMVEEMAEEIKRHENDPNLEFHDYPSLLVPENSKPVSSDEVNSLYEKIKKLASKFKVRIR